MRKFVNWLVRLVTGFLKGYVKWISINIDIHPYRALLKMYGPVLGISVLAVVLFSTDDDQVNLRPFGPQEQIAVSNEQQAQVAASDEQQAQVAASDEQQAQVAASDEQQAQVAASDDSLSDIDTQSQRAEQNRRLYDYGAEFYNLASDDSLADDTKYSYLNAANNAWRSLDEEYITRQQIREIGRLLPGIERRLQQLADAESDTQTKTVNSSPFSSASAPTISSPFSSDQIRELLSEENGDEIPDSTPDSRLGTQIDSGQSSNTVSEIERTETIDPLLSTTNEQIKQIQSERLLAIFQIGSSASADEAARAITDIERIQASSENQVAANDYVFRLRNRIQNIRSAELTALADSIDDITDAQDALNMISSWQILYNELTITTDSDANPELEAAFGKIQNIENEANQTLSIISNFGSCDSLVNLEIEDFQVNTNVINRRDIALDNILADANLGNQDNTVNFGLVLNGLKLNISLIFDSSSEQHSFSQSLSDEEDGGSVIGYNKPFGTTPDDSVRIHSELRQRSAVDLFEEVDKCFEELSRSDTECAITPSFEFSGSSKFGCQFQGSITGESVTYSSSSRRGEYTISKRIGSSSR